ncbi:MAG: copper chaperone PCu(A)C [Pseudomonadota bacterium]
MFKHYCVGVALTLLIACSGPSDTPLVIDEGWVRATPPSSGMTAAYGRLINTSGETLRFSRFSSPQFGDVSLHITEEVDGRATMREVDATLKAGDTLTLEPGGYHLMLMQRLAPTPEGSDVEMTFYLDSGERITQTFPVERR